LGGNWKIRPAAGMVFNRAWFQIIDACPHDVIARIRYWDKAATEGGGAYTCGVKMARTEKNLFIVEDVIRGQWSSMQRERVIEETARMDGPNVYVWVEQEPGSGGKESAENTVRRLAGYVAHADRVTGDKLARAEPYAAQVEAGNTYLVRADWNKQYIDELDSFPDGRYVDQADASSGAFNKLAAALIIEGPSDEVLYGIPANEYGGRI
jgi:predicted phage terminase large subunit-like protein